MCATHCVAGDSFIFEYFGKRDAKSLYCTARIRASVVFVVFLLSSLSSPLRILLLFLSASLDISFVPYVSPRSLSTSPPCRGLHACAFITHFSSTSTSQKSISLSECMAASLTKHSISEPEHPSVATCTCMRYIYSYHIYCTHIYVHICIYIERDTCTSDIYTQYTYIFRRAIN